MRTPADKGGGGSKIGKILRTSFMYDPLLLIERRIHQRDRLPSGWRFVMICGIPIMGYVKKH